MPLQFWNIGEIPSLISTAEEDSSSRKIKTFQTPNLSEKEYSQFLQEAKKLLLSQFPQHK